MEIENMSKKEIKEYLERLDRPVTLESLATRVTQIELFLKRTPKIKIGRVRQSPIKRKWKKWEEAECLQAIKWHREGWNYKKIARELGRTRGSVMTMLSEINTGKRIVPGIEKN